MRLAICNKNKEVLEVEIVGPAEDCVNRKFEQDVTHNGIRYVAKLRFKPDHELLLDNYSGIERRLKSLGPRLIGEDIYGEYNLIFIIKYYEMNVIVEKVSLEEIAKEAEDLVREDVLTVVEYVEALRLQIIVPSRMSSRVSYVMTIWASP